MKRTKPHFCAAGLSEAVSLWLSVRRRLTSVLPATTKTSVADWVCARRFLVATSAVTTQGVWTAVLCPQLRNCTHTIGARQRAAAVVESSTIR